MNQSVGSEAHSCAVMVIEDEPLALEATARYLESRGYDVVTAAGAAVALAKAEQHAPDVVVCDWHLGSGPDGVAVARNLKKCCGAAIIFTTAHPIEELRVVTRDLGVSHYFRKPVSLPQLADAIADTR